MNRIIVKLIVFVKIDLGDTVYAYTNVFGVGGRDGEAAAPARFVSATRRKCSAVSGRKSLRHPTWFWKQVVIFLFRASVLIRSIFTTRGRSVLEFVTSSDLCVLSNFGISMIWFKVLVR